MLGDPLSYVDPLGGCSVKEDGGAATDDEGAPCASGDNNSTTVDGGAHPIPLTTTILRVGLTFSRAAPSSSPKE